MVRVITTRPVPASSSTGSSVTATGSGLRYVTAPHEAHVRGQAVVSNSEPQVEQCESLGCTCMP